MSDRITFRPGDLAAPLAAYCERHGVTPSEATRIALAKMLKVEPPQMPEGNPAFRAKRAAKRKRRKQKPNTQSHDAAAAGE